MTEEVLTMSRKEIGWLEVIRRVVSKRLRRWTIADGLWQPREL